MTKKLKRSHGDTFSLQMYYAIGEESEFEPQDPANSGGTTNPPMHYRWAKETITRNRVTGEVVRTTDEYDETVHKRRKPTTTKIGAILDFSVQCASDLTEGSAILARLPDNATHGELRALILLDQAKIDGLAQ